MRYYYIPDFHKYEKEEIKEHTLSRNLWMIGAIIFTISTLLSIGIAYTNTNFMLINILFIFCSTITTILTINVTIEEHKTIQKLKSKIKQDEQECIKILNGTF
jgi:Trk-type K+ transport system membrane component